MKHLVTPFGFLLALLIQTGCQTTPEVDETTGVQEAGDPLAQLHTQLGVGYMREGNLELAWKRLQRAVEVDPDYADAHNALAILYERLGRPEKSEQHYRKAIALNPTNSAAHSNYGAFLCRANRHEEAEEHFLKAISNPLYAEPEVALANAGLCMYSAGNADKSESYLRRALVINPRLPGPLLTMAALSLDKDRALAARGYLQRYLEVASHTSGSLWLGIRIERALGDRNAAASYALLLKANYPDSQETQMLLESGMP